MKMTTTTTALRFKPIPELDEWRKRMLSRPLLYRPHQRPLSKCRCSTTSRSRIGTCG
jgi:hypothetical protein